MLSLLRERPFTPRQLALRQTSLFADLSPRELRVIDSLVHQRAYLAGEVVFDEGERGEALYLVLSGRVRVQRLNPSGETLVLAEIAAGDFFGDLALLDDAPRAAQARAFEATQLAALFRADFLSLLETHGALASRVSLQLARHLGQRLRQAIHAQAQAQASI
jgi:CRP/FNR family cyclic AMP-dependent transcriptional regulator